MNIIRIVVDFQLTCPKQNCPKIIKSIKQVKTVNITLGNKDFGAWDILSDSS